MGKLTIISIISIIVGFNLSSLIVSYDVERDVKDYYYVLGYYDGIDTVNQILYKAEKDTWNVMHFTFIKGNDSVYYRITKNSYNLSKVIVKREWNTKK